MRCLVFLTGFLLIGTVFTVALFAWNRHRAASPSPPLPEEAPAARTAAIPDDGSPIRFEDLATTAGIDFSHIDGRTNMEYLPEVMGGGVAWIDYDQDGFLDLFLVQGGPFPPDPGRMPQKPSSRLYRNQGDGTFVDVTEKVGIRHAGYGQGVAVGDYDNDGYPDLFVSCFGSCHLFHNEPDGTGGRRFRDVTQQAGIAIDGWCSSCAFGDIHGNGYLDLFVCRYVALDLKNYPFCGDKTRDPPKRQVCGPREFHGTSSVLLRNNGDGTFTDVSQAAGVEPEGKG